VVRQWRAVGMIKLPGHAPLVAAEDWRPAGEFDRDLVEIGDPARSIRRVDRRGNCREQFLQALLAFAQPCLDLLALGDVARDLRGSDNAPGTVADRRYRERDVDEASVLATTHGFKVVDAFAGPDLRQDF